MPQYLSQHDVGSGRWTIGQELFAENDEEAQRIVVENLRLDEGWRKLRITKVVFEGLPTETGFPLPERAAKWAGIQAGIDADIFLAGKRASLDYSTLTFSLRTVPEATNGAGHDLRLLYAAGEGFMRGANMEEVAHARDVAKLAPGDVTLSAYYIKGPEGAQCVSLSKVTSFEEDEKTPKGLIHLWPLEFDNLAIDPQKLQAAEIKDNRKRSD